MNQRPDVQQQLDQLAKSLVGQLSPEMIRQILVAIETGMFGVPTKAEAVRLTLVSHLNARRPQLVRRLFTSFFEPLIATDVQLALAPVPLPGLVLRADLAALWRILAKGSFAAMQKRTEGALRRETEARLSEDVLETEVAMNWRAELGQAALTVLDDNLRDRKAAADMLAAFNKARANELRPALGSASPAGVDLSVLRQLRDIIASAEKLPGLTMRLYEEFVVPATDPEIAARQATAIIQAIEGWRAVDGPPDLAYLLPVTILYRFRAYRAVAEFVRENPTDGAIPPVSEALVGLFSHACLRLADGFERSVAAAKSGDGPLILTPADDAALAQAIERFAQLLDAVAYAGLFDQRRIEVRLKDALTQLSRSINEAVLPTLARRAGVAAFARRDRTIDHVHLLKIMRAVWDWRGVLADMSYATAEVFNWRQGLFRDFEEALNGALKLQEGDRPHDRMGQLLRLSQLYRAVDLDIGASMAVTSRALQTLARDVLAEGRTLAAEERALIQPFVQLARNEAAKIRYWHSPMLTEIIALADNHGL
ncbi:MAG: hypothetical protein J0H82_13905 [Alphaproteobacteria bacterium]|jgi:hypothetical protein|nr:hypothetical protein [Alphaproteobacteria bacterium]